MWIIIYFYFAMIVYLKAFLMILCLFFPDACIDEDWSTTETDSFGPLYVWMRDLTISSLMIYFTTKGFYWFF